MFQRSFKNRMFLLGIPLILSAFVHLWNPLGFPGLHPDEGHYLRRSMQVLSGAGPQETISDFNHPYDHPYFGQIFLAGVFRIIGFPYGFQLDPSEISSVKLLYEIPRLLMGVLAVIDTLVIFCIANRQYNQKVAFVSSLLFAVMPFTWVSRRIYLDNMLMPFLLSSIYFALYLHSHTSNDLTESRMRVLKWSVRKSKYLSVILSGIFLGTAVFTKIPVITLIPLIGYLVFKNTHSIKILIIWMIPVIVIPALWPLFTFSTGHFNDWLEGIHYQETRTSQKGILSSLYDFFVIDPVMSIAGLLGLIYAFIKRDIFILLWIIPFFLFSYMIGWSIYFHLMLIFPVFCIGAAVLIDSVSRRVVNKNIRNILPVSVIACIVVFGFISSTLLIVLDVNSNHIEAYSHVLKLISSSHKPNNATTAKNSRALLISHWIYFWLPKYVWHEDVDTTIRSTLSPLNFSEVSEDYLINDIRQGKIIVVDDHREGRLSEKNERRLILVYNKTSNLYGDIDFNQYPYTSLKKYNFNLGNRITIRTN